MPFGKSGLLRGLKRVVSPGIFTVNASGGGQGVVTIAATG